MERWKDIKGFDGYEVSSKGRVKSNYRFKNEIILDQSKNHGYLHVHLYKDKTPYYKKVHRLVGKAFVPNPDEKPFINHKNGIKDDNRVENLDWCTRSENMKHAFANGLQSINGEKHPSTKLTNNDVIQIRNCYKIGCFTHKEIANAWNVSRRTIGNIINRNTWTHI